MTETTRLLRDLVRIPSVNPMGRPLEGPTYYEHQVTAYVEEFLRGLGVAAQRQPVAPLRDNVWAKYEPPNARRTLAFEVHQDTVPVDGMTIDPFAAVIEGGKLYGRGACDVKGGMAAMLAAFARLVRERPRGDTAVILACVVDEEYSFQGIRALAESGPRLDAAIVAEPTGLDVVHAHKGAVRWFLHVPGRACHSSSPEQGINAIYRMGRLLVEIERFASQLRQNTLDPLLGPATLSVGRIEGGISVNTVPELCRIEIDRRVVNGEDPARAPDDLANFLRSQPGIDFPFISEPPWMCKGALSPKGSEELVERLGRAIDAVVGRHRVVAVPYGTDASTLARHGIPAVVFGPGDIAQAHVADEWIDLAQVEAASEILVKVATE